MEQRLEHLIKYDDLDISKIEYSEPKLQANKVSKSVYMSHDKKPIIIQLPPMFTAPYGLSCWPKDPKPDEKTKWSLDLSFKGYEDPSRVKPFYDKMNELDQKLIQDGCENSALWLSNKHKSTDVTEAVYTKIVKWSKDKNTQEINTQYPPTFKFSNLQLDKEGNFTCAVFDQNRNKISLTPENSKGTQVVAIVQCLGLWISGKNFGCSWKLLQLKMVITPNLKVYSFLDDNTAESYGQDIMDSDSEAGDEKPNININEILDKKNADSNISEEIESSEDELDTPVTAPTPSHDALKKKTPTRKTKGDKV